MREPRQTKDMDGFMCQENPNCQTTVNINRTRSLRQLALQHQVREETGHVLNKKRINSVLHSSIHPKKRTVTTKPTNSPVMPLTGQGQWSPPQGSVFLSSARSGREL